jgi:hypothetical protein
MTSSKLERIAHTMYFMHMRVNRLRGDAITGFVYCSLLCASSSAGSLKAREPWTLTGNHEHHGARWLGRVNPSNHRSLDRSTHSTFIILRLALEFERAIASKISSQCISFHLFSWCGELLYKVAQARPTHSNLAPPGSAPPCPGIRLGAEVR